MAENTSIHYLEVVTKEVDEVGESYANALGITFSDAIPALGNARTAILSHGEMLGIRAPMHTAEEPTTRPYYLVDDIHDAVRKAEESGAQVAVPPMEIPVHGTCAVVMYGSIQSGFWQI